MSKLGTWGGVQTPWTPLPVKPPLLLVNTYLQPINKQNIGAAIIVLVY